MHDPDDDAPLDDAEFAELRSLVERAALDDIEWEAAPPGVWNRIAAEVDPDQRPVRSLHGDDAASPPSRRRRWWIAGAGLTAAAAAAVAVVVIANDDAPDTQVLASVDLEPLAGSGSGSAELISVGEAVQLRLRTAGLATRDDGYFEVWLINPSVTELVSLGPLRADGEYDVPAGVDPAAFPIVDVSVEPVDGNPAHSGESVLRGELPT